jgi:hypothetical protein
MELAHLPYKKGRSYEDYLGLAGLERLGKKKWQHHVAEVVQQLKAPMQGDYVVLGGGNARLLKKLPPGTAKGRNVIGISSSSYGVNSVTRTISVRCNATAAKTRTIRVSSPFPIF